MAPNVLPEVQAQQLIEQVADSAVVVVVVRTLDVVLELVVEADDVLVDVAGVGTEGLPAQDRQASTASPRARRTKTTLVGM